MDVEIGSTPCKKEERASQLLSRKPFLAVLLLVYKYGQGENMITANRHWNAIFSTKMDSELGWYERDATQTLKFLELIPGNHTATIFLPGAGTSVLVEELLSRGSRLILNDISDEALDKLKNRIGHRQDRLIGFIMIYPNRYLIAFHMPISGLTAPCFISC